MKKPEHVLVKISADQLATNLVRGLGQEKAVHVAEDIYKGLSHTYGDADPEVFSHKSVNKNKNVWTQVRNVLKKRYPSAAKLTVPVQASKKPSA